MEHRIAMRKLSFYHHLRNLPDTSLAFQIAEVQSSLGLPGLVQECQELLLRYNLPDATTEYSKNRWKNLVKRNVRQVNRNDLLDMIRPYKKLNFDNLSHEKFELKEYLSRMNLVDARMKFAVRARMTTSVMMNFKGVSAFKNIGWRCQTCQESDTQEHVMICPEYRHLREGKSLRNDNDLVEYFRKVVCLRGSAEQLVF